MSAPRGDSTGRWRRRWRRELAVEPDAASRRLLAAIERGEPVDEPPAASGGRAPAAAGSAPGNLPAPLTGLVGAGASWPSWRRRWRRPGC